MDNTIVKEMPTEIKDRIVESEFDLDIRVFTPAEKTPQAFFTLFSCGYCSNSCATCYAASCFTCGC